MQKIFLYIGDIEGLLNSPSKYEEYLERLSGERQIKAGKIKPYASKCRSVGAGILLNEALKEYGICEKDMSYAYGKVGKPGFAERPNLFFNLSHSGSRVMCVMGDVPVGCDIERIRKVNPGIAKRFFSDKDNELLSDAKKKGEQEYRECFYTLWTLKESFIKCIGLGLKCPMNSFSFISDGRKYIIEGKPEYIFYTDIEMPSQNEEENENITDRYAYSVCLNSMEIPEFKISKLTL
ncbi:MAG: 4'-phosphopantetheinyl transferase superfamily protein [Lachnospiraceae bacterium]|nr:4'-phosphopantetheinyl transferase superfamily protein [Lachnospiraceae bacterium]